jgi:hypothetical protein
VTDTTGNAVAGLGKGVGDTVTGLTSGAGETTKGMCDISRCCGWWGMEKCMSMDVVADVLIAAGNAVNDTTKAGGNAVGIKKQGEPGTQQ